MVTRRKKFSPYSSCMAERMELQGVTLNPRNITIHFIKYVSSEKKYFN